MSVEKCKSAALRYVAMQIKTEGQVTDYLNRKNFGREEIEQAIELLKEYKYIDDVRYCCSYYKEACQKGRGRRRIEQELERKKIAQSVIREALDELLSDSNPDYEDLIAEALTERERALAVGKKMLQIQASSGKPADKSFMAKVGRRLVRLGYDSDVIYSVIGNLMKEGEQNIDDYE